MFKTSGEEFLARIVRASFLKPWVFPNLYYKSGKELADIVVRFDDTLIIFSEKSKSFNDQKPLEVVWPRWQETIDDATHQCLGAEKQILRNDPKLFLDSRATVPAPAHLFGTKPKQVHHIVVMQGASEHVQRFFSSRTGSLVLAASVQGERSQMPFSYNPFLPNGRIRLVLDDYTLQVLFEVIDTVPDLINYLQKREKLLRSVPRFTCHGEEELLFQYCRSLDPDGEHGFQEMIDTFTDENLDGVQWDFDTFQDFLRSPEFETRKRLDEPSYVVDKFIDYTYENCERNDSDSELRIERSLRRLAATKRVERRIIGKHLIEFAGLRHPDHLRSRLHFLGRDIDTASEAFLLFSSELFDPMPKHTDDPTFQGEYVIELLSCYAASIFARFEKVKFVYAVFFTKDGRFTPVARREGISFIQRHEMKGKALEAYLLKARQIGIGRWDSEPIHWREREYDEPNPHE